MNQNPERPNDINKLMFRVFSNKETIPKHKQIEMEIIKEVFE